MTHILDELAWRGLLAQTTDEQALREALSAGPVTVYCGFDPTAPSLHHGNLVQLILLRHLQLAGHRVVALVGGATGMIGDPRMSGERVLNSPETVAAWGERLRGQISAILDFDGDNPARMVNNLDWTAGLSAIDFLRDVGKHYRLGTMLAKDTVARRLASDEGISFTEFSYQILQGMDYLELYRRHGVTLQSGGNDQWGNLLSGVELVRKVEQSAVHAMTTPLITKADGTKFGKSEGENIWLSADRTSPYRMYQYLLNVADSDVAPLLLRLTTVPVEECAAVAAAHEQDPSRRTGQRRLAREITSLVHGPEVIEPIEAAAGVLFGTPIAELDEPGFSLLAGEIPLTRLSRGELEQLDAAGLFAATGLASSKGEVRRNPQGHYVNQVALSTFPEGPATRIGVADALHGRFLLLRRGKTAHHLVELF